MDLAKNLQNKSLQVKVTSWNGILSIREGGEARGNGQQNAMFCFIINANFVAVRSVLYGVGFSSTQSILEFTPGINCKVQSGTLKTKKNYLLSMKSISRAQF